MAEELKKQKIKQRGLHFCRRYMNLVRYDPELCGVCVFNGIRERRKEDEG